MTDNLRDLSPMNENYVPARPWKCLTRASHDCVGPVIGALGALPVCANGADAERAARQADRARINAWADSPEGRAAIAAERRIEERYSW